MFVEEKELCTTFLDNGIAKNITEKNEWLSDVENAILSAERKCKEVNLPVTIKFDTSSITPEDQQKLDEEKIKMVALDTYPLEGEGLGKRMERRNTNDDKVATMWRNQYADGRCSILICQQNRDEHEHDATGKVKKWYCSVGGQWTPLNQERYAKTIRKIIEKEKSHWKCVSKKSKLIWLLL